MKKNQIKKKTVQKGEVNFLDNTSKKLRIIIVSSVLLLPVLYLTYPYLIEGLSPVGTDSMSSIAKTSEFKQWENSTGNEAFWNPNVFGGMPIYYRTVPTIIHIDSILKYLGKATNWFFIYLLAGSFGIFFFLCYKKIPWYLAVIPAIVFSLLPDWQALIGDGHYSKLRAVMAFPWVLLSFNYLFDKKNWLSVGLFALAFSWILRTQHFQIVFYAILTTFILFIYPYIKLFIEKKYKEAGNLTLKFTVALILTISTSALPFLTTKEYAPHSTRGGNPVEMTAEDKSASEASGVGLDYATQWSLNPAEIMDFFIARFHGGISNEIYDGDKYPQYKGQQIGGTYWGEKPFSGNYAFIGMMTFILALIGAYFYRDNKFVIAMSVFVVFSLFLSFGRHFPELYKLFYYYVPYFSKFRAPSMLANITFIALIILSGYGLKSLLEQKDLKDKKIILGFFGSAIVFAVIVLLMQDSFSYIGRNAGRMKPNVLEVYKNIRQEFLHADTMRLLLISLVAFTTVGLYLFNKIKKELIVFIILGLIIVELLPVTNLAFHKIQMNDKEKLEQQVFRTNSIAEYLNKQDKNYRAIGLGNLQQDNHYAYYYPLISGYSAIKLQVIQDILANNLYNAETKQKINWNIINMLGGKFVLLPGGFNAEFLKLVATDKSSKTFLYENENALPKAWFVKSLRKMNEPKLIIREMNKTYFDPSSEVLTVEDELKNKEYTASGNVKLIDKNPNEIIFDIETNREQFLVVSEIYYPEGWKAYLNDKEIDIYKVNHLLRGLKIPSGEYKLTMKLKPDTYYSGMNIVWVGNILMVLLILVNIPSLKNKFIKQKKN